MQRQKKLSENLGGPSASINSLVSLLTRAVEKERFVEWQESQDSDGYGSDDGLQDYRQLLEYFQGSQEVLTDMLNGASLALSIQIATKAKQWAQTILAGSKRDFISDCYAASVICRQQAGLHCEEDFKICLHGQQHACYPSTLVVSMRQALTLIQEAKPDKHDDSGEEHFANVREQMTLVAIGRMKVILDNSITVKGLPTLLYNNALISTWKRSLVSGLLGSWTHNDDIHPYTTGLDASSLLPSPTCDYLVDVAFRHMEEPDTLSKSYKIQELLDGKSPRCMAQLTFALFAISARALQGEQSDAQQRTSHDQACQRMIALRNYLRRRSSDAQRAVERRTCKDWLDVIDELLSTHDVAVYDDIALFEELYMANMLQSSLVCGSGLSERG